jgi:hypothetical protein
MNANHSRLIILVILVLLFLSGCSLPFMVQPTPLGPEAVHTQAARTVIAKLTEVVASPTSGEQHSPPPDTSIPPTNPPTIQPTQTPTITSFPTQTPLPPTATPVPPTPTPTPIPCNWANFVEDVSIKDGSVFGPNAFITKTWRLRNNGTCTWTSDYKLVYESGEQMGAAKSVNLPRSVKPGEMIDVSVELVTPQTEGRHRGYWRLADASGQRFGIGNDASASFYIDIKVAIPQSPYAFDFLMNSCAARWYNDDGPLPCPQPSGSETGFAIYLDSPRLENGQQENEPGLLVKPQMKTDGWLRGEYPLFAVEPGHHLKSVVGCLHSSPKCDVIFQVNYLNSDNQIQTLWETREIYEGSLTDVDIDLTPLAGQKIRFILTVLSNGSSLDDNAVWLLPRITK